MDGLIDLLDIAAKEYPVKALAFEIDKAESTLRNELTQQPGYKLGLLTAVLIMSKTDDLRALDRIEDMFNRVAFNLPEPDGTNIPVVMEMVGSISREFGESMQEMSKTIVDGKITKKEAERCIKEIRDLIKAGMNLLGFLEQFLGGGKK